MKPDTIIFEARINGKWINVLTVTYWLATYKSANRRSIEIANALDCEVRWLEKDHYKANGHVYLSPTH